MEKYHPKISVIIPVYGVEKYIRQCLESIINQTYKNLEIIVVNDGTKDNSMKIVEEYLSDERIKIINKQNGGLSSARNRGMEEATGKYIFFVDSDDWIELNTIEILVKNSKSVDIVGTNFFYWDEIQKIKKKNKELLEENIIRKGEYFFNKFTEIMVWNKLYRYSFLKEKKLIFLEGIIHEDEEFTFKCYMNSPEVKYINEYLYNYRVNRENSIMNNSKKNEKLEFSIKSLEMIVQSLKESVKEEFSLFIKMRFYLRERNLRNLILKKKREEVSKEEICKFEENLKKFEIEKLNESEKIIIKNEIRNIIFQKELIKFRIFNKFYWKNGIFNIFYIRKIISRKIIKR